MVMKTRFSEAEEKRWFTLVRAERDSHPRSNGQNNGLTKALNAVGKRLMVEVERLRADRDRHALKGVDLLRERDEAREQIRKMHAPLSVAEIGAFDRNRPIRSCEHLIAARCAAQVADCDCAFCEKRV